MIPLAREFRLIERHFRPLAGPAARNLADDAAVLDIPPGQQLVVSADAMVEGVHYLPNTDPALIARKLLRVNLSDLAAMGAAPLGYLLTIAVPPDTPDDWFAHFAAGLAADQAAFCLALLGGDSTATPGPTTTLSCTILGTVPAGTAISRSGARPGDAIYVTGTLGDGALGLHALRHELPDPTGQLAARYHLPSPRLHLAHDLATAAIDLSDGLFAELGHLCRGANLAAAITEAAIPFSSAARATFPAWYATARTGGDDYELLLAIPPEAEVALQNRAKDLAIPISRIGHFQQGDPAIRLDGVLTPAQGWSHFSQEGQDPLGRSPQNPPV